MNEQVWTGRFEPRRKLGRTGFVATILGIGDLADRNVPFDECVATARRAIDAGLNVIDTAPGYENGTSERIVGEAVRAVRERMFVIDKIDHHDEPVGPQVDGSLDRLGLEAVDLFVFHGCSTLEGWRRIAADGMDQLAACVKAGKCRFRGISSHHPDVLAEAIPSGLCDVVLFPVGAFCDSRYVERILPLAREHGVGTVCFKTFGAGKLVADTAGYGRTLPQRPRRSTRSSRPRGKLSSGGRPGEPVLPHLPPGDCVRYTLTCDPDVALLGLSFPNEQDPAFEAAADFRPLTDEPMADLRRRAAQAAADKGPVWWDPKD